MGKFGCTCGNSISLNSIPEFAQAVLITDIALDNAAGDNVSASRLPGRLTYECDECGRLWIETAPRSNKWISFVPEGEFLKFRDDYGKGYKEEPPVDERMFDVLPSKECRFLVTLKTTIAAGYRGVVATPPLKHKFKAERAFVPDYTPTEILLHASCLIQPSPISFVLSSRCDLQRPLFKPAYEEGEKVEFEVENTLDVSFDLAIAVVGLVSTADVPLVPESSGKVPGGE